MVEPQPGTLALVNEYLSAFGWAWLAVMIGVVEGVLVFADRFFNWKPSKWAYGAVALACLPVAGFFAWKDQRGLTTAAVTAKGDADTKAARFEGRLEQAKDEIANLRAIPEQKEMQALRERIEAQDKEIASLRDASADRELSDEQIAWLADRLRAMGTGTVFIRTNNDYEMQQYGRAFARVFEAAKWKGGAGGGLHFMMNNPFNPGLWVLIDPEREHAEALRELFEAADLSAKVMLIPHDHSDYEHLEGADVAVCIGARPKPSKSE